MEIQYTKIKKALGHTKNEVLYLKALKTVAYSHENNKYSPALALHNSLHYTIRKNPIKQCRVCVAYLSLPVASHRIP